MDNSNIILMDLFDSYKKCLAIANMQNLQAKSKK